MTIELPRGSSGPNGIDYLLDVARHGGQIAVLHIGENIEDWLHIVVIDIGGRGVATQVHEIVNQLRRVFPALAFNRLKVVAGRRNAINDRRVHERFNGVDAVGRRLHGHAVVDAVHGVDPIVRRLPGWSN